MSQIFWIWHLVRTIFVSGSEKVTYPVSRNKPEYSSKQKLDWPCQYKLPVWLLEQDHIFLKFKGENIYRKSATQQAVHIFLVLQLFSNMQAEKLISMSHFVYKKILCKKATWLIKKKPSVSTQYLWHWFSCPSPLT